MSEKSIAEIAREIYGDEQRLLHYPELTDLILKRKRLAGKTPEQTVRSAIGTKEKFKRVVEGVSCPTEWQASAGCPRFRAIGLAAVSSSA